jgi:lactobin A/cerein 7B family class IIb bacteriocin
MDLSDRIKQVDVDFLELTKEELEMVSGGFWWIPVVTTAIVVWDAVDDFVEGMRKAYDE